MARHLDLRAIQRGLINEKALLEGRLALSALNLDEAEFPDSAEHARLDDSRERKVPIRRQVKRQLALVKAALSRLEAGTYGWCVRCHNQINPQRLLILPAAPLCFECQLEQRKSASPEGQSDGIEEHFVPKYQQRNELLR